MGLELRLSYKLAQIQSKWNEDFKHIESDSLEGEDIYSVCLGYCIGLGLSPNDAHRTASDTCTILDRRELEQ